MTKLDSMISHTEKTEVFIDRIISILEKIVSQIEILEQAQQDLYEKYKDLNTEYEFSKEKKAYH